MLPLGNSKFQIDHFVMDEKGFPGRKLRKALLQLKQKEDSLAECRFRRRRLDIDRREIQEKLKVAEGFEKERLEIDLEEIDFKLKSEVSLIEDCIVEAKYYRDIINSLPKMSREEFEGEELEYWKKRLLDDVRREILSVGHLDRGTVESLEGIGIFLTRNEKGQLIVLEKSGENLLTSGSKKDCVRFNGE